MAAPKTSIELLPQEEWQESKFGRILKWALTVGRHIVIFTELIVILAFLSRFKLDRDLADLGEKIKSKQNIVASASSFEEEFRFLQKRLQTIETMREKELKAGLIITELAAIIPLEVKLSNLSIKSNSVSLTATSLSEGGLAALINNLKKSKKFEKLTLTTVETAKEEEKEVGIKFQLNSTLVKEVKNGS